MNPPNDDATPRKLYVAVGIDCDPDRDAWPGRLAWRGVQALRRLFDIPDTRWTFNIRADTQIRDHCGSAAFCREQFHAIWDAAASRGHELAWHLHYFGRDGRQDVSEANIRENVEVGSAALGRVGVVHMGWTFQNDYSLRLLAAHGVHTDYSPAPRLRHAGRRGVDAYDWSAFAQRPQYAHGVRMVPTFSFPDPVLTRRFGTERLVLTTTTHPLLFRRLLTAFFSSGLDYLVSYFHADEIADAVGGVRDQLYQFSHLEQNLRHLRDLAARRGHDIEWVTVGQLATILFDAGRPGHG